MVKFGTPRGTQDFLPAETAVRNYVERIIRQSFEAGGFQPVQTPVFEEFALFSARSGEEIRNSMFTFWSDQFEYALRPELTAPICRLVASGRLSNMPQPYKLYYIGDCFRYGRPQAGRYREFTQAGLELMGSSSPVADAEIISLAVHTLKALGISPFSVKVGNIGVFRDLLAEEDLDYDGQSQVINQIDHIMSVHGKCQAIQIHEPLEPDDTDYVRGEVADLYRLQEEAGYKGNYEILPASDYSESSVRNWLNRLPAIAEHTYRYLWTKNNVVPPDKAELLIAVSQVHGSFADVTSRAKDLLGNSAAQKAIQELDEVCTWLKKHSVSDFEVVLGIARGLDFYTSTVFEIESPLLGAQKQLCGGGRYDKLVEEFGGTPIAATGFAFGFDRICEVFEKSGQSVSAAQYDVFITVAEWPLLDRAVAMATELRKEQIRTGVPLQEGSLSKQLGHAARTGSKYAVILGSDELSQGMCKLRDMAARTEELIKFEDTAKIIKTKLERKF
jgi:histidyl-tRNA synthetase